MSKYIIEADERSELIQVISVMPNGTVYTNEKSIDELEELNSDYINEHFGELQDTAYQKGINNGSLDVKQRVEGAYQRGLDDAWECARKIVCDDSCGGMGMEELLHIFNRGSDAYILRDFTAKQAIAKLKAYEEKQKEDDKIVVGDEVIYNGTTKCLVVRPETDERYAVLIDSNGNHHHADHSECKKTGRHFDIQSILEAMKV